MDHTNDDNIIVERYQSHGNANDLTLLFKTHKRAAFGVAYYYLKDKDLSMDVVMDAFEVVLKHLATKHVTNFKGWLLSIVRNQSLKHLRDRMRTEELNSDGTTGYFMESDVDSVYTKEAELDRLVDAVEELKPDQRNCIRQFYLENKSYAEVAEALALPINSVKSQIQNGKRNLSIILKKINKHG